MLTKKVNNTKRKCYQENHKEEKMHLQYLLKNNPCISGPTPFKPMLFKGELYFETIFKVNIRIRRLPKAEAM